MDGSACMIYIKRRVDKHCSGNAYDVLLNFEPTVVKNFIFKTVLFTQIIFIFFGGGVHCIFSWLIVACERQYCV